MAHYCRICGGYRPNESFSAKGHRTHVCKRCTKLPKARRQRIEETDEIIAFLSQSNISEKNQKRLATLAVSPDPEVARIADLVLAVAKIHPHKRRRMKFLENGRKELLDQLANAGLIEPTYDDAARHAEHDDDFGWADRDTAMFGGLE